MEFPPRVTAAERALTACLLICVGLICLRESRSALASSVREGRPWLWWLALNAPGSESSPQLTLAVYQPARRRVDLFSFPSTTRLPGGTVVAKVHAEALRKGQDPFGAARSAAEAVEEWVSGLLPGPREGPAAFVMDEEPAPADAPALAARAWVLGRAPRLALGAAASSLPRFDRLLLALELSRVRPADVRPVWVSDPTALRSLLGLALSPQPPPPPGRALTAEVLNAAGLKGIASQATKVLRLKGVDVVSYGNLPEGVPVPVRTLVYDRTGRLENAAAVKDMLACPTASALTEADAKRLVDVTVVLADDCAGP